VKNIKEVFIMGKFSIDEIMDKLTPDDPTIYARIAIPLDTLIEDIHSYDDFYDKVEMSAIEEANVALINQVEGEMV
jgi:hypothetical protein